MPSLVDDSCEFSDTSSESRMIVLPSHDRMFIRLDKTQEHDGRTDGRTSRYRMASTADNLFIGRSSPSNGFNVVNVEGKYMSNENMRV